MGLRRDQVTDASTASRILQTTGGAFGSAILATILANGLSIRNVFNIATVSSAYNVAFGWSIVFTVIATIPALLLLPMHKNVLATAK